MSQPPYDIVDLPDWHPPLTNDAAINNRTLVFQSWVDSLPALGFSLLFEAKYVSLDAHLSAAADLLARRARYGKEEMPSSILLRRQWHQWWRHPDGVISTVDRGSTDGGATWLFNSVEIIANIDVGYGKDQYPTRFAADGSGVFVPTPRSLDDLETQWRHIRDAGLEGQLIPLARWPTLGPQRGLLEYQEWTHPLGRLSRALLETPSKRYHHAHRMRRRHLPALTQSWKHRIEQSQLPAPEKRLWLEELAREAGKASIPSDKSLHASSYGRLPAWVQHSLSGSRQQEVRRELGHERASRILADTLADFGLSEKGDLTWDERAVATQWLAVLEDLRHPRCQAQELARAFSMSIERLGVRLEHVLFRAAPQMRGVLGKLAWWQDQQDPATLARLCQEPDHDGRTLPMRWMRVWMEVLNQRVFPRKSQHRRIHARRALDNLIQAANPASWVLSTPQHSMWDPALGHAINLPMDQDLVAEHRTCLLDLLSWLDERKLQVPSEVVLAPAVRMDLHTPQSLAQLLDRCYDQVAGTLGPGTARAALLDPITAHLQRASLEQASPMPCSRPAAGRGARL